VLSIFSKCSWTPRYFTWFYVYCTEKHQNMAAFTVNQEKHMCLFATEVFCGVLWSWLSKIQGTNFVYLCTYFNFNNAWMIDSEDEKKRVSSYTRSHESSGRIPETQNTRNIYCSAKRNKCCVQYVWIRKNLF